MYKATIYSIPGSGTKFMYRYIQQVLGYKSSSPKEIGFEKIGKQVAQYHCLATDDSPWLHIVGADVYHWNVELKDLHRIIPIRHPILNYLTLENKGVADASLAYSWATLEDSLHKGPHCIVPIDSDLNRKGMLNRVNDFLEAEIEDPASFERTVRVWPLVGKGSRNGKVRLGDRIDYLLPAIEFYKRIVEDIRKEL